MPKKNKRINYLPFTILLWLTMTQSIAQVNLNKSTINSGGSTMSGASFTMKSSIGQVSVSNEQMGGTFALNGGFWQTVESAPIEESIFKNDFES